MDSAIFLPSDTLQCRTLGVHLFGGAMNRNNRRTAWSNLSLYTSFYFVVCHGKPISSSQKIMDSAIFLPSDTLQCRTLGVLSLIYSGGNTEIVKKVVQAMETTGESSIPENILHKVFLYSRVLQLLLKETTVLPGHLSHFRSFVTFQKKNTWPILYLKNILIGKLYCCVMENDVDKSCAFIVV